MAFTQTTIEQLVGSLQIRLGESGTGVFWGLSELQAYVVDALRTYNAITGFWRSRVILPVVEGQDFYDLPTTFPSECGFTVTSDDLTRVIEWQLLEPTSTNVWTGSAQFSLDGIVQAMQKRRDAFLWRTGQVQTSSTLSIIPGTRMPIGQAIMDIRHAQWLTADNLRFPLVRDDVWSSDLYRPLYETSPDAIPTAYSVAVVPPLWIQVLARPADVGMIRLLTVNTGTPLTAGTSTVLGVPDDWAWVTRFGTLADLLVQEGISNDVTRAQYCERRWAEGVALGAKAQCALTATFNTSANMPMMSLAEAEAFGLDQLLAPGSPMIALTSGFTTIMVCPIADAGSYSGVVDLVRKMPIPAPGEFVQLPQQVLDGILDYAEHLAAFKMGGAEFLRTMPLLESFYTVCGVTTDHFRAMIPNYDQLSTLAMKDEQIVPREVTNG